MKILLLGANGQVGWELQRSLAPLGAVKACDRHEADFEDLNGLKVMVREYHPDVIVNAAAYTAVDKAESEQDTAYRINTEAVALLANEAIGLDAWLIHYSTDYVYDGAKADAYVETDETNPVSVYGKTKLQGEVAIKQSQCKHLTFRTSWVYAARGANFIKTMMKLANERDELKVVSDQKGAPTSAELIADITSLCLYRIKHAHTSAQNLTGTYHLSSMGETSWHGFAQFVIAAAQKLGTELRVSPDKVLPIYTSGYPVPAARPANSILNTHKLVDVFGVYLPHWEFHVHRLVKELYSQEAS